MKNVLSVLVFGLFSAGFAASFLHLGGGLNISSTSDADTVAVSNAPRNGFNIGAGFERRFTERFSITTGIGLETRGEKESKEITLAEGVKTSEEWQLNMLYLSIPVLAQYTHPLGNRIGISFFTGPLTGMQLNAQSIGTVSTIVNGEVVDVAQDTIDFADYTNMLDISALVGMGIELSAGPGAVFIRGDYALGLTDFLSDKNAPEEMKDAAGRHYDNGRHSNFSIRFGYTFILPEVD